MKYKILFLLLFSPVFSFFLIAQTGPGGIGDTSGSSNLQLWLRAGDLALSKSDGERVVQWEDQSGARNHVYGRSVSAPTFRNINGVDYFGVEFQGAEYLQTNGTSSSFNNPESTIFIVKRGISSGTSIAIASRGWLNEMLLFDYSQFHHSSSGNFNRLSHPCLMDIPNDEATLICGVFGKTPLDLRYFVNGLESTEAIYSPGTPRDFESIDRKVTIGQRDEFVQSEFFEGILVEVIVYNSKLTDGEILSVENYLRCSYEAVPTVCSELEGDPCPTTTSIRSIDDTIDILLSPNPSRDYVNVSIVSGHLTNTEFEYSIYDQLGRMIKVGKFTSQNTEINTTKLDSGIYYLELKYAENSTTKKFIVAKN